jgi:hypothetical protein
MMSAKNKRTKRLYPLSFYQGPGKRHYLEKLNFLLVFLNSNFEKLSPGAFSDLFYQLLLFFYENTEYKELLKNLFQDRDEDRRQLNYIQQVIRAKIENLKEAEKDQEAGEKGTETSIDPIKNIKYILKEGRISIISRIRVYPYDIYDDNKIEDVEEKNYIMNIFPSSYKFNEDIDPGSPEPPSGLVPGKFSKFIDLDIYETIKFAFYSLLEKIPLSSINRCPKCQKYFKSTIKKQSPFCASCLKKENTYKWREKNKSEYNTYQRNLQKGLKTSVKDIRKKIEQENKLREE